MCVCDLTQRSLTTCVFNYVGFLFCGFYMSQDNFSWVGNIGQSEVFESAVFFLSEIHYRLDKITELSNISDPDVRKLDITYLAY